MPDPVFSALPGERVIHSNELATVTTHCLIVRSDDGKSSTIIPLSRLSTVGKSKTTYPGLLVVAAALFLLAAASLCSKHDDGAGIPMASVGALFLLAYIGYRKAAVIFVAGSGTTWTPDGNVYEATALIKAVKKAQVAVEPSADSSCGELGSLEINSPEPTVSVLSRE